MIKDKIKEDIKKAMQEKDELKLSVLRMASSAVFNKEKDNRAKLSKAGEEESKLDEMSKLTEEEVIEVVSSEVKKRKDSIEQYQKGGRSDLAENEKKELEILMEYMPEQMGEDEIRKIVKEKIEELGISSPQETGKLMGVIMPQFKGKTDGNIVGKIVQEELKN
ncbi:MAG: GatB/YqeY domain-containing protein [Patescibacteria group bacterium]|nr:GatB/YqeY domain-containing protein [Patescibacteria group bacterium]